MSININKKPLPYNIPAGHMHTFPSRGEGLGMGSNNMAHI